jgi:hypothetical protein
VAPFEIPALAPWEGYYVRNASDDTVRLRIPAIRAPSQAAARIADLHLRWEVRGADGKDAGNHFGALPSFQAKRAASGAAALSEAESRLWQAPKPESPDAGLRTGFVPAEAAADGLLQTDFRSLGAAGGAVWKARLSGLRPGQRYTSTFPGFEGLQEGMALGVAYPATGTFRLWKEAGESYVFEAQAGETTRELEFYSGTTDYVRSRGEAFAAAHPIALAMRTYPNPARAFTVIRFAVPALSSGMRPVRVSVYDLQGRLVKRLSDGPLAIGWHTLRWDLRDTQGRPVAAGSYRLLLEAGDRRLNQPLQILP